MTIKYFDYQNNIIIILLLLLLIKTLTYLRNIIN
nr:MAG TPA: hypothetical protein [Caudoviricetes sp.]